MTDNYEWMKTNEPQSRTDYSPYTDKQYSNYINDINGGSYSNSSLSLVNFDLGQIYNSNKYLDSSDLYIVLPITMVAAYRTNSATVAPGTSSSGLCSIKTNFLNLIHQCDLQINGKTIESTTSFINIARHFQLISEMSTNDLLTLGPTLGFAPDGLDNVKSMKYTPAAVAATAGCPGYGISNNRISGSPGNQITIDPAQNTGVANGASQYKVGRYIDTNAQDNGMTSIVNAAQMGIEFRPYYTRSGHYMIWHDYAVIKVGHLFESINKIGLVKRLDASIRIWVNTGTVNVTVGQPNQSLATGTLNYGLTTANNTFSNTCPLMINYLPGTGATGGIPDTVTGIVAGLYINKPPVTTFNGINLSLSAAQHPLPNCRLYYSQIAVEDSLALKYDSENHNKQIVFRGVTSSICPNVAAGSNYSQLINAGIVHPTGILLVPFLSKDTGFSDVQWKSPFDSCPATTCPVPLTNLQVNVGGNNILQSNLFSNYENFISQVNLAESLTSSDFGVSVGLFNQAWWEWSRFYYVNIERSAAADKMGPRNINISFTNGGLLNVDVMVFIFYSDEFRIDINNGLVNPK